MRSTILLLLLAATATACGSSPKPPPSTPLNSFFDSTTPTPLGAFVPSNTAFDNAFMNYARNHDLRPISVPTRQLLVGEPAPEGDAVAVDGLAQGESLVRVQGFTEGERLLVLKTPPRGGSCDAPPSTVYRVATSNDDSLVIVQLVPRVHERTEHRAGTCGVSCGVLAPWTSTLLLLPNMRRVQVVSVEWDAEVVHVTCDHPIPRP